MKIEPTFIFVAVLVLGILGYGLTGAAIFSQDSEKACLETCAKIVSESAEACLLNGTYYKKDFFVKNFCSANYMTECLQAFCRPSVDAATIPQEDCKKLCDR